MISLYFNNTLVERDMDMLFLESAMTYPGFCQLLIDKTDLKGKTFQVIAGELSKSDDLGESDITVIVEVEGQKYGLLIEDKIDAIAMPNQHERYVQRGKKAVKNGAYDGFRVFIFCPEKYYKNNAEAKKYEHRLTYEECKAFFDKRNDSVSEFRSQQIEQAIIKGKKPATNNVNENANAFLRQYIKYQKENYPSLDLSTKEDKNGWWTDFRTELGYVYINHKIREGHVDLTFPKASENADRVKIIADWARHHKMSDATVVKTKKSVMIRIHVPQLDIEKGFEAVDVDELNKCFETIKELTEFANMIEMANSIAFR